MLPENVSARIIDPADEMYGHVGWVMNNARSTTMDDDEIPTGWVEMIFDPLDVGGVPHRELYRESALQMYC